jgi:uncharacterized membrane protein
MNKSILALSTLGVAFSGYLSSYKFFSDTCALGETCPYFLGVPACYFGFIMFLALTILSHLTVFNRITVSRGLRAIQIVSGLGILFAGYFTAIELPKLFSLGLKAYILGLPTCALGLIFYVIVFGLATKSKNKSN